MKKAPRQPSEDANAAQEQAISRALQLDWARANDARDRVASRRLIEYFHKRQIAGISYDEPMLLAFVMEAFARIVDESYCVDHALGLKLKRGKYLRVGVTDKELVAPKRLIRGAKKYLSRIKAAKRPPKANNWDLLAVKFRNDGAAAVRLITFFRNQMREERAFNLDQLLDFVFHIFAQIVGDESDRGISGDQAIGLRLQKGKYFRKNTWSRDVKIAAEVVLAMRSGRAGEPKTSWEAVVADVEETHKKKGISEGKVKCAYTKYKAHLEPLKSEWLQELIDEHLV